MTDSPTKGAILALNRRSHGLTQAQAAALIHVSTATWQGRIYFTYAKKLCR